ncbi:MAG: hypothetical protein AB2563_11495 [Candidatus Thiodiazotropha endolucinida]
MNKRIIYEPKVNIHFNTIAPDTFSGIPGTHPSDDFVVSRKHNGGVASLYGDNTWDWSAYEHTNNSLLLIFDSWVEGIPNQKQLNIIKQLKLIMFAIIWFRKEALGTRSLQQRTIILRDIARYVDSNNITLQQFFNDANILTCFLKDRYATRISHLPPLIKDLIKLGQNIVGIKVLGGKTLKQLSNLKSKYLAQCLQHPPIPSRIYLHLIIALNKELDEFEAEANNVLALLDACSENALSGLTEHSQKRKAKQLGIVTNSKISHPTFSELVNTYGLHNYFSLYKSKTGLDINSTRTLSGLLRRILHICKQTIHLYSGMRDSEVLNLPFHCHEIIRINGKSHHRILGWTTKLNHGHLKPTNWVTSTEGARAIDISQKIAMVVYKKIGDLPKKSSKRINKYPLFVSLGYLEQLSHETESSAPRYHIGNYSGKFIDNFPNLISKIEESDIKELEKIDPHRSWRSEVRFQVGNPWPLSSHQFRRSLAIYASNSGYVSLPTLRRYLQHITEEMTIFYARGSAFAKDLIKNSRSHFAKEYQDSQPESQALAYIAHVLLSDERLFGTHGEWIERHVRTIGFNLSKNSRMETLYKFKRGEISYRETHLGGCTELGKCDKKALRSIIGCLDCNRSVIKLSKLERLIKVQKSLIERLKPETMEWRTENADLEALQTYRDRILSKELLQ